MFGVPWLVWTVVAAVVAIVFGAGLGSPKQPPPGGRGALLRWGHAAVWLALAALFLALSVGPAGGAIAGPLGAIALVTYAAFVVALITLRRR
jgi:hypothetical protein